MFYDQLVQASSGLEGHGVAFEMPGLFWARDEMSRAGRTVLAVISPERFSPVPRPKSNKRIKRLNFSDPSPKRQRKTWQGRQNTPRAATRLGVRQTSTAGAGHWQPRAARRPGPAPGPLKQAPPPARPRPGPTHRRHVVGRGFQPAADAAARHSPWSWRPEPLPCCGCCCCCFWA